MCKSLIIALLISFLSSFLPADDLPRRPAPLGFHLQPTEDGGGLTVQAVVPGYPAEVAGFQVGDVLVSIAGERLASVEEYFAIVKKQPTGKPVMFAVLREGKSQEIPITLTTLKFEEQPDFDIVYDVVESRENRMRCILTKPRGNGPFPVLFYVQGINCMVMDQPGGNRVTFRDFCYEMTRQGFATFRVEKTGMGDSVGMPCGELDLNDEIFHFTDALRHLKEMDGVNPDEIFLFGHSMGGTVGPCMAAREAVRGVIVFGGTLQTWDEYWLDNVRRQNLLAGDSWSVVDNTLKQVVKYNYLLGYEKLSPKEICEQHPELTEYSRSMFPNDVHMQTRHYRFLQQLMMHNVAEEWEAIGSARVLVVAGEADFLAGPEGHRMIADAVNSVNPGAADFILMPNIDHAMNKYATMAESMASGFQGEYNPEFEKTVLAWMRRVLAEE